MVLPLRKVADRRFTMNFKARYLAGEIEFESIEDYTYEWGISTETCCTLREYLGLNEEEEDVWISISDEALKELLDQQKGKNKE